MQLSLMIGIYGIGFSACMFGNACLAMHVWQGAELAALLVKRFGLGAISAREIALPAAKRRDARFALLRRDGSGGGGDDDGAPREGMWRVRPPSVCTT